MMEACIADVKAIDRPKVSVVKACLLNVCVVKERRASL